MSRKILAIYFPTDIVKLIQSLLLPNKNTDDKYLYDLIYQFQSAYFETLPIGHQSSFDFNPYEKDRYAVCGMTTNDKFITDELDTFIENKLDDNPKVIKLIIRNYFEYKKEVPPPSSSCFIL